MTTLLQRFTILLVCLSLVIAPGTLFQVLVRSTTEANTRANNPIMVENQKAGTTAWQLGQNGRLLAEDVPGQIKGYASAASVNLGSQIGFKVSVSPAQSFTLDIYRMGYYGGTRGRLMQNTGAFNGTRQADCPIVDAASALIECNWATAYTLTVPADWTSGVYLAHLINASGYENYILFIVRDDARPSDFIVSLPTNTYQAYNEYPIAGHGTSLYTDLPRAFRVSYDRPYMGRGDGIFSSGDNDFVSWTEREGYDVKYITNVDVHTHGEQLRTARAYISGGHDEYWSLEMRNAAVAARDVGVNLAFFSANDVYWQVRFEPSTSGVPNRVLVGYKEFDDTYFAEPYKATRKFRDVDLPDQQLVGVQYTYGRITEPTGINTVWLAGDVSHWAYAGSGLVPGQPITGILGAEMDRRMPEYALPVSTTYTTLSSSPFTSFYGVSETAESVIYQAPSGAYVFGTGTINWSHGLDRPGIAHAGIRQITKNIFDRYEASAVPSASQQLAMLIVPATTAQVGGWEWFYWAPGLGAQAYRLQIGTQPGSADIWDGAETTALSALVPNLPADGRVFYTTLWTKLNGAWTSGSGDNKTELTYTPLPKIILNVLPGKVLGTSQRFSWNTIPNATTYYVDVGTSYGLRDIYAGKVMTQTSAVISGLPADGRVLYVAIGWRVAGKSRTTHFSFVASGGKDGSMVTHQVLLPVALR